MNASLRAFLSVWSTLDPTAVLCEQVAAELFQRNPDAARKLNAGLALAVARANADAREAAETGRELPRTLRDLSTLELSRLGPDELAEARWRPTGDIPGQAVAFEGDDA